MAKSIVDYKRGQKNKNKIFRGLIKRGFSKEEASVIMGNLRQESAYDTQAELRGKGENSYGLMQWRDSKEEIKKGTGRLKKLKDLAKKQGKHISDLDLQLDYIKQELTGGGYETRQFKKAMSVEGDLDAKTMAFARFVERPHESHLKKGSVSYKNRTEAAREFFNMKDTEVINESTGYKPFPTEHLVEEKREVPKDTNDIISMLLDIEEEPIMSKKVMSIDIPRMKKEVEERPKDEVAGASISNNLLNSVNTMKEDSDPFSDEEYIAINSGDKVVTEEEPERLQDTNLMYKMEEETTHVEPKKPEVTKKPEVAKEEPVLETRAYKSRQDWGGQSADTSTWYNDLRNTSLEGMGDDMVNKFVDQNIVGLATQALIKNVETKKTFDSKFDPYEDKELFDEMTKGLDNEELEELLKESNNRHDFITNGSLAQARLKRQKEMMEYAQNHPVLSGVNTVGNMLLESAMFMPVGTIAGKAAASTKIKTLTNLTRKSAFHQAAVGEFVEQTLQELMWAKFDKEYSFDPIMFAGAIGLGVGLKTTLGSQELDKAMRDLLANEGGFINIATAEGKKLVDEVAANTKDSQAIMLAQRITKKKVKEANIIRKNLDARYTSLQNRLKKLDDGIKANKADKEIVKKLKGQKQKVVRMIKSFEKKLPNELEMLAKGTHPKLTAAVNPEFKIKNIAKELGIPKESVSSVKKLREFLGLDGVKVNPDFVFEGEKPFHAVMRDQLREMADNRRINMNETLKYMAGTDTVKTIDGLPLIGKMQIGDKLRQLAETDGPVSRMLFNKGNLVSSENEYVAGFYNWLAPDGAGRQGMSKIRAIESQQKYSNIYGGDMMNIYHSHGDRLYEAIEGSSLGKRIKGFISPDSYEETVEPLFKERMLIGREAFTKKYGEEIGKIADDFADDWNALNKKIAQRMQEVGVEGADFEVTEDWFTRSWDFRKVRAKDVNDVERAIFRGMKNHMEKLGVEIDEAKLFQHARKFTYGIRNADISVIEGVQSDHIKLLSKLLDKAEGVEAKVIKSEIERLKRLQMKAEAGDLARRVQMDVNVKLDDGSTLADLFEDNIIHTQKRHASRMSARIAAAEHGIKNINDLDDWVNEAVEQEVKRLADKGVKNPREAARHVKESMMQDLQSFKHGGMSGLHDLADDTASDFVRYVKKYNYARLMQYTGISSIAELGGTFVEAGVSTTLNEMARYMRNHFEDLWLDNPRMYTGRLYDELRSITGVGMEDFSFSSKGLSKATRITETGIANQAEKMVDSMGRITQGTFGGIEKVGRRITANALAIKWANHFTDTEKGGLLSAFFGSNGVTNRVLENSGFGKLDELGNFIPNDNYKNIKKSIKEFASFDKDGRLVRLNLEKWDNNTAHAFGDAITMQASHIMVNPDATTMALWQSSTVGQILNQFRTFTVNATTKVMGQTIANAAISANRGDQSEMIKAAQKIFWGTSLGMLSVTLRQGIQRAGGDKDVDLFDEGLIKATAIGFSRSSVAGNIPTIADTISGAFGIDPIFEKTSSIGRSKNFFNLATSPTGQAIGGIGKGVEKGLQGDFKGAGMQLLKTSPVYRTIGAQQIFNFYDDEK